MPMIQIWWNHQDYQRKQKFIHVEDKKILKFFFKKYNLLLYTLIIFFFIFKTPQNTYETYDPEVTYETITLEKGTV